MLSNYEASGIIFLSEYLGEEGEIIGGFGVLPSWTPGLFHLDDKERFINEQMIKQ